MLVREIIDRIENGSAHVLLWNYETGEVFFETIWYNLIDEVFLDMEVMNICVRDYEIRLGVL